MNTKKTLEELKEWLDTSLERSKSIGTDAHTRGNEAEVQKQIYYSNVLWSTRKKIEWLENEH